MGRSALVIAALCTAATAQELKPYEDVTNVILDDLVSSCDPKWMLVESTWSVRGGIHSVVRAQHGQP